MRQNRFFETDFGEGKVGTLLGAKRVRKVITVGSKENMGDVVRKLKQYSISQVPVVDSGKLQGMVTEFAILEHMFQGHAKPNDLIQPLVSKEQMEVVSPESSLEALAEVFNRGHIAVVLDEGSVGGILTKIDLISYLAEHPT